MNIKNFGGASQGDGKQPGNFLLARQPSVYSLTFEEFQNTWGGLGKDLGSMNMDELLKNIWTAEESQVMTSSAADVAGEANVPVENLQRQGSLTLRRTLSQKTVDEVWRYLIKEGSAGAEDMSGGGGGGGGGQGLTVPQRQQTLGEMTLEEFLARAGVVREDILQIGGRLNNTSLALGFQQPSRNNGQMGIRLMEGGNSIPNQPPSLALNVSKVRSSQPPQQQPQQHQYQLQQPHQYRHPYQQQHLQQHPYWQQQQPQHQAPLLPKQPTVAFASPGARGSVVSVTNPSMNTKLVQAGGLQGGGMGMVGLGAGGVNIATGSPPRRPPGYAFIDFDDHRDAKDAIREIDGKNGWRVELSHNSRGGGGGGGGRGGGRGRSGGSDLKCYECGEPGHFARECRLRGGSGRRRSRSPRYRRSPSYGRRSYSPNGRSPRRRSVSPRGHSYSRSPPYRGHEDAPYANGNGARDRRRSRS